MSSAKAPLQIKGKGLFLGISALIVILDQISKHLVVGKIPLYSTVELIRGFFQFNHIRNPGGVWGIFSGHFSGPIPIIITGLAVVALILVILFFLRLPTSCRFEMTAFSFVLGGALGNIIDRMRQGYVVDFLDFFYRNKHFPIFNVSDSFITIGVLLLAIGVWRGKCSQF